MPLTATALLGDKLLFVFCRLAAAEPVLLVGRSVREDDDCAPIGVVGVCEPFTDGPADDNDGRFWLLPLVMGTLRLVERLRMSLPLTTRLSLDLRRSFVIISNRISHCDGIRRVVTRHTITACVQVYDTTNANIHHTKKALIFLLELLLVEYLYSEDAFIVHAPIRVSVSAAAVPRRF